MKGLSPDIKTSSPTLHLCSIASSNVLTIDAGQMEYLRCMWSSAT